CKNLETSVDDGTRSTCDWRPAQRQIALRHEAAMSSHVVRDLLRDPAAVKVLGAELFQAAQRRRQLRLPERDSHGWWKAIAQEQLAGRRRQQIISHPTSLAVLQGGERMAVFGDADRRRQDGPAIQAAVFSLHPVQGRRRRGNRTGAVAAPLFPW